MRLSSYKEERNHMGAESSNQERIRLNEQLWAPVICVWGMRDSAHWLANGNLGLVLSFIRAEIYLPDKDLCYNRSLIYISPPLAPGVLNKRLYTTSSRWSDLTWSVSNQKGICNCGELNDYN